MHWRLTPCCCPFLYAPTTPVSFLLEHVLVRSPALCEPSPPPPHSPATLHIRHLFFPTLSALPPPFFLPRLSPRTSLAAAASS